MWHAQLTGLTLRLYNSTNAEESFDKKEPYAAIVQVVLLGNSTAFLHSAVTRDGEQLSVARWLELASLLKENYGVHEILMERHGKLRPLSLHNR